MGSSADCGPSTGTSGLPACRPRSLAVWALLARGHWRFLSASQEIISLSFVFYGTFKMLLQACHTFYNHKPLLSHGDGAGSLHARLVPCSSLCLLTPSHTLP